MFKKKHLLINILLILFLANGCSKNNDTKKEFIKKNIEKTNNRNISKHGELIVPDFLLKYNETN